VTIADPAAAAELGVVFSANGPLSAEVLAEHARLAVEGTLRVRVAGAFPLAEAGSAQERSATGHTRGKLILRIQ
jgi:NADPH:quinone reductase-like Zn-dependent oxidoreductase